jgi:DNA-binding NarL/FixJ family response regulator
VPAVAIVDDHELLADMLATNLAEQDISAVVIRPVSAEQLLTEILALAPRLVLLDLDLGSGGDGLTLVEPLTRADVRVLVLTGTNDQMHIALALEQGAVGYQLKSADFDSLLARIAAALRSIGNLDLPERARLLRALAGVRTQHERELAPFARLTAREQQTLRALSNGETVQAIARSWVVSPSTVRSHVRGILDKLDLPSQLAAVTLALRSGWVSGP